MHLRIPYWVRFGAVTVVSAAITVAALNIAGAIGLKGAFDPTRDTVRQSNSIFKLIPQPKASAA